MSAAATNARSTAMAPPGNGLKRKTLADRAGETSRPAPGPPSSRPLNSFAGSISTTGGSCEMSHTSSLSSTSRPPSALSARSTSNSSHSSSIGPGNRLPLAQSYRAQSSMGHSRLQRPASHQARPATSLERHHDESKANGKGIKEKCMVPISSFLQASSHGSPIPNSRKGDGLLSRGIFVPSSNAYGVPNSRQYSPSKPHDAVVRYDHDWSVSSDLQHSPTRDNAYKHTPKTIMERPAPSADACFSQTSSYIPKLVPHVALPSELSSPIKSLRKSPKKPCELPLFLNRETNTRLAWDTDSRLDELENQHARFKEEIGRATSQTNSLHETIQIYKLRSRPTNHWFPIFPTCSQF